jgi:gamma-glutamyltranspeptidase / glutathione hydrolase
MWKVILVSLGTLLAGDALGQDRAQSRSLVASAAGIVASESVLASQTGARVLEEGGNAVDAAIAANAMMGLVAPMNDGIGGDLFAIVYEATSGRLYGLNASGWASEAASAERLAARGLKEMPLHGIDTVTVPGTVAGWEALRQRFGSRSFASLLAPSIRYAEEGFPVGEVVSVFWKDSVAILKQDAAASATFLPLGRAPVAGERFRNPELAASYRALAKDGAAAFYRGAIAHEILAAIAGHGGAMTAADLRDYRPEWVEPIATEYRGWKVYELPPNGQGIAALMMLNIMERYPLADYGHNSVRALHLMIEAKKLAYADLIRFDADPRFAAVPVAGLLARDYAAGRARLIDPARASCQVEPGSPRTDHGTTYLATIDKHGNMVSLIQSNYSTVGFGSGLAAAGFALHNRGALFSLEPGHPNQLAPRKRPLHTIIPAFMAKGERRIAFGIMGGWNQAQAHAQFVANVADFGLNIQAAIDAPRFSKDSFGGCDVALEARVPESVRVGLAALGHEIEMRGDYSAPRMGSGQAVERDGGLQVNLGASDPRKDGAAVAELLR